MSGVRVGMLPSMSSYTLPRRVEHVRSRRRRLRRLELDHLPAMQCGRR